MLTRDISAAIPRAQPPFEREALARAKYDARGVFREGRTAELEALRDMGRHDAACGRLYEGHLNGALLVALYGSASQRAAADADVDAGALFGVWNTQDDDPVRIEAAGKRFVLHGAKTWASGADAVTRAIVTARDAGGALVICNVPLDRVRAEIDGSAWSPLGMQRSNSYRVVFEGVELGPDDLVGAPGDYERPPHFLAGALRFLAVHCGIVDRLVSETLAFLVGRGRAGDPYQIVRAAELRLAARTAWRWVEAGRDAWVAWDRDPSADATAVVLDTVDLARMAVERAALDVHELVTRSVGARGLVDPLPFGPLLRDLQMYLRQPAPDAVVTRVGIAGLDAAR